MSSSAELFQLSDAIPELQEVLDIGPVIGEGTFSTVYIANLKQHLRAPGTLVQQFAVKHITPVADPLMLQNELECLISLEGKHNIIPLEFACRFRDHLALVMPYYKHDRFHKLLRKMNVEEMRTYLKNLLEAVNHIHSQGIIHRDLKPNNFLFCMKTQKYALVDFGLAQKVGKKPAKSTLDMLRGKRKRNALDDRTTEINKLRKLGETLVKAEKCSTTMDKPQLNKRTRSMTASCRGNCTCYSKGKICKECVAAPVINASRAGTAGYRPPEVLLKVEHQTTAVDIWATGIIFLCMLSGRVSFFNGQDDMSALAQMMLIFGHDALVKAAKQMGKAVNVELTTPPAQTKSLKEICVELRKSHKHAKKSPLIIVPDSAYDLLSKLLTLNPEQRITASDALSHPFITGK